MSVTKSYQILELLREISSGREVSIKAYATACGLSERTIRRYISELREFFGKEFIVQTTRGSYICKNRELFRQFFEPNSHQNESEKLIELLHIINPGFANHLPPTHQLINQKLSKDLASVFLIKGSPHENTPNLKIFKLLRGAVKFRRYIDISYKKEIFKEIKPFKIIYSKGNWQLAVLTKNLDDNNGFKVFRLAFIDKVKVRKQCFYADEKTLNFIKNQESFWDGYKISPYKCEVAISPEILEFFKQKKFFKTQNIADETFKNGWIKVEFEITSDDMILMLARRWFPNFIIISPKSAKEKFDAKVNEYSKFSSHFSKIS